MTPKTPSRRDFLRRASGHAAALAVPAWLAGCGGGGGGGDDDPNGGGTPPAPAPADAVRAAAIAGVERHCRHLSERDDLTPLAFVQAVADRLNDDPAYVESGVDAETLCAWGVFADGRVHVISRSFTPRRQSRTAAAARVRASAAAADAQIPAASTARVMQSFGPMFDGADVVTDLVDWLTSAGWRLPRGAEQEAHLATLRGLQGAGYFYINTHGGAYAPTRSPHSGVSMYSIQSSTLVSPAQEALPETQADMAAHRLTYFTATNGDLILGRWPDWDTRYAITSHFVDTYWRFADDAVVMLNACSSARVRESRWAAGFVFACHKAGARVVMGWDETVTPTGAYRAARYVTDRLLGANRFEPETPAQRPFPCDAVMTDLQRKGIDHDPGGAAVFRALSRPGATMEALLAPTIRHLEIHEGRDELRLVGQFGRDPGEVTVDGQALTVREWSPERVVAQLPRTGPGAVGPAQVIVRGVKSNLRALTEWTVPVDTTYTPMESVGLAITGQATIRLRADVAPTRDVPGQVPDQPVRYAYDTRESHLPLTARGQYVTPKCTVVWTGSATYRALHDASWQQTLAAWLKVDTATRRGWLGLGIGTPRPDFLQTGCGTSQGIQPSLGTMDASVDFPTPVEGRGETIPMHAIALNFDAGYRLAAGRSQSALARLVWPATAPVSPPLATHGV